MQNFLKPRPFFAALALTLFATKGHSQQDNLKLVSQFDAVSGEFSLTSNSRSALGIEIKYSSKSRHRGLFGWGWCSDLDASVSKSKSGAYTYHGCDLPNADIMDPRQAAKGLGIVDVKDVMDVGFIKRVRADGVEQFFDEDGFLVALRRPSGETAKFVRQRDLIFVQASRTYKVYVDSQHRLAREIGFLEGPNLRERSQRVSLRFDGVFLAAIGDESFQYDFYKRMIRRERASGTSGLVRELVGYQSDGKGIERFERHLASPEGRLLVTVRMGEESGKIEIKAERGAEMHPVRIFYDMDTKTIELFGDRQTARKLLPHLKS